MARNINSGKLSKEYILSKVSQITIFSTFLNISSEQIQYCIDSGDLICSPLREDKHPTCGFRYDNKGKLKFKDFAGYFWGDCFDIAALILSEKLNQSIDISNKHDFVKVLRYITFVYKDIFYGKVKDENLINDIYISINKIRKRKSIIELVVRDWNKKDIEYWSKFHIPIQFLNINFVYPIDQYYIDRKFNPEPKYYYNDKDLCYGYFLGRDRNGVNNIKLYFPNRNKNNTRFITNCNHLEGIYNLNRNNYDIIILTKSSKDRLCIGANLDKMYFLYGRYNIKSIGVINIPHETYKLRNNEYEWLRSKLTDDGIILSLMDNDRTGLLEAKYLRDTFNITPLIIPKDYNAKDFSELVEKYNFNDINKLCEIAILKLKENGNSKFIRDKEANNIEPF